MSLFIRASCRRKVMHGSADVLKDYITEFSRLQNWMLQIREVAPDTYSSMYDRYTEIKVALKSLGVDTTELDKIRTQTYYFKL
jgi:hypothetical protein